MWKILRNDASNAINWLINQNYMKAHPDQCQCITYSKTSNEIRGYEADNHIERYEKILIVIIETQLKFVKHV